MKWNKKWSGLVRHFSILSLFRIVHCGLAGRKQQPLFNLLPVPTNNLIKEFLFHSVNTHHTKLYRAASKVYQTPSLFLLRDSDLFNSLWPSLGGPQIFQSGLQGRLKNRTFTTWSAQSGILVLHWLGLGREEVGATCLIWDWRIWVFADLGVLSDGVLVGCFLVYWKTEFCTQIDSSSSVGSCNCEA